MHDEYPKPGRVEGSKQGIPYLYLITLTTLTNAAALLLTLWWLERHLRRVVTDHVELRLRLHHANPTKS
jgi:hypothetical protein